MATKAKSRDELKEMSMLELACEILKTEKQPLPFQEIVEQIKDVKQLDSEGSEEHIARLYTNVNLDGRFIFIGENHWGLREWYPFDQSKEDIEIPKPKRKRKKKKQELYDEDEDEGYEDDAEDDYEDYDEEDYEEDDQDEEEDESDSEDKD
ncbi:MAG TPA: DNA-directed RNA polymerase subunit delta [Bacillales bacterium]|nr:DNA-directed RNA polymerase subunit delta [Bacillales bacterium]HEU5139182.1 DNA-directed RNA polymerase subunit delta [Bacillales bacterium]